MRLDFGQGGFANARGRMDSWRNGPWRAGAVVACLFVSGPVAYCLDNSWNTTASGSWQTGGNWSLGIAPASTQSVFIVNGNSKTVTIDATTSGSFPGTLTVSNLTL